LVAIKSFTALAHNFKYSQPQKFLDLFIVPSRQQWPEYQDLLADIIKGVASGNSQLSSLGYKPIRLHIGNDYSQASLALSRYDYLIVCSVADGLNLVVKEGAILNNRNGVIISTSEVGAMAELGNFCIVADDATESGVTKALIAATKLDSEIRKNMSVGLKNQIQEFDASYWAQSVTANFKILEKV
jgi:trehalose 6-phosphate synthase